MDDSEETTLSRFRGLLTKIDGELNREDVDHLIFLCEPHLNSSTQQSIQTGHHLFEVLERKGLIGVNNVTLLNVLFEIIGRLDLLEMVPNRSGVENDSSIERMPSVEAYVSPFNHVLYLINEELCQEEVQRLRYAYGKVPRNAQTSSALDLFKIMKKQKAISSENLKCLRNLLETIDRNDLTDLLENVSSGQSCTTPLPSPSVGAGDSIFARPCPESPSHSKVNENLPSPIQSCPSPVSHSNTIRPSGQQVQDKPMMVVSPLSAGQAPVYQVQVSRDHSHAVQTTVKSLPPFRNVQKSEFAQSLREEHSGAMESADQCYVKSLSVSRGLSVPSGSTYHHQSGTPAGLPYMNFPSYENHAASMGEAAQVSEEPMQTEIPVADDDDDDDDDGGYKYKMTAEPRENLRQVFQMLKFDVEVQKNISLAETREVLQRCSRSNHVKNDCFVCCFLSHGCEGAVYCSDALKMEVKELTSYFSPKHCPSLGGKPKLFFLSCCQGKARPDAVFHPEAVQLERDGPPSETDQVSSEAADFLIGYATMFGYAAFRDTAKGTIYVQVLTDILRKHYKKKHLVDMLVMVNADISKKTLPLDGKQYKQVGAPQITLTKQVWF